MRDVRHLLAASSDDAPQHHVDCKQCGQPTSYGKPYCLAHVLHNPQARATHVGTSWRRRSGRRVT